MKQAMTLSEKQLKIVLAYTATRRYAARDRAIVMVSYLAGLRAKEIASLTVDNVRDAEGIIREEFILTPEQTKGRKSRRVFVSTRLRKELEGYLNNTSLLARNASLFQSQKGGSFSGNTMCQLFLDIYSACGLDGASSHSGRRTLLTALAAKGVGVRVLQEIAGHSSIAVTQRYLDVNDAQLRSAIELF